MDAGAPSCLELAQTLDYHDLALLNDADISHDDEKNDYRNDDPRNVIQKIHIISSVLSLGGYF